jgi:iron(III) transport system ATP-binding protein
MKKQTSNLDSNQRSEQIRVNGLTKSFGTGDPVVDNLSFTLHQGDILALLGPSGCGKTTSLRMIAGFETPDAGEIYLHGRNVTDLPPQKRKIGIVFQDYALFPHMRVADNIMFGMRLIPVRERPAHLGKWLDLMALRGLEKRYPHQLSGGQQQRVALARTLAAEPDLLLLDEPFSNLDAALRNTTRNEMRQLIKETGVTVILVTHDQAEALTFADQVGMMTAGKLCQLDTPEQIYQQPENAMVAEFLGHTNLLLAELDGQMAKTPLGTMTTTVRKEGTFWVSVRPEHLEVVSDPQGEGRIITREFRGPDCYYEVEYRGQQYKVLSPFYCILNQGDPVSLRMVHPGVVLKDDPNCPRCPVVTCSR